jgi:hypothetical protein
MYRIETVKLIIIGDTIVTDDLDTVAVFDPRLLPTKRDLAEELLLAGAGQSDWELQLRVYEYEDRIAALESELEEQKRRLQGYVDADA